MPPWVVKSVAPKAETGEGSRGSRTKKVEF